MDKPVVTPEERQALASIYAFILNCCQENKAAGNPAGGNNDAKGESGDRAEEIISKKA